MNIKALTILLLTGCSAAQEVPAVVDAAKDVAASCYYLKTYADEAHNALMAKDYRLASILASNAYYRSLEDKDTPCLKDSKQLLQVVHALIIKGLKETGVEQ